jgi:adenosylmethionine-8-amino-7-oxononanoate aminotransferase
MPTPETKIRDFSTMNALFRRKLGVELPIAVSAQGCWLTDNSGKQYLDASGGCAVVNVGHGVQEIADAVSYQARTLPYVNGTQFSNTAAEDLAEALTPHLSTTVSDPRCYFLTTGSEAVEAAVKLARQVWVERGQPAKWHFISRIPGYHGNSLTGLALSSREHYKTPFAPMLMPSEKVPSPWGDGEDLQAAEALEKTILKVGAENVAAFIAEPIGGSSTGAVVPDQEYWPAVREICNRHNILLIADEVMSGMGRTGRWLASEHFNLQADIVTLGKGLNGGYAPLSAMIASGELVETLMQGSGQFLHAGTYTHTPVICAAGLATVRFLEAHSLVKRSAEMGEILHQKLQSLKTYPSVGKIRGKGLFAGVEFLQDPASRKPFPRSAKYTERLIKAAMQNGLILWPNVGHVNGEDGDLVILAPPFTITLEEIDMLVDRLSQTIATLEASHD